MRTSQLQADSVINDKQELLLQQQQPRVFIIIIIIQVNVKN